MAGARTALGNAAAQLPANTASPARLNDEPPFELTSSWNGAPQATGACSVATNPKWTVGGLRFGDSGPHSISFGRPSGCPGTQRAVASAEFAPPTKDAPAGATRMKYCHVVVPLLNKLKSYVAPVDVYVPEPPSAADATPTSSSAAAMTPAGLTSSTRSAPAGPSSRPPRRRRDLRVA